MTESKEANEKGKNYSFLVLVVMFSLMIFYFFLVSNSSSTGEFSYSTGFNVGLAFLAVIVLGFFIFFFWIPRDKNLRK